MVGVLNLEKPMNEKHRHPKVRNEKRSETSTSQNKGKPGRQVTIWTYEEVALLIDLNERFKNLSHLNVKIREFLPRKILKQISDKRRALPGRACPTWPRRTKYQRC